MFGECAKDVMLGGNSLSSAVSEYYGMPAEDFIAICLFVYAAAIGDAAFFTRRSIEGTEILRVRRYFESGAWARAFEHLSLDRKSYQERQKAYHEPNPLFAKYELNVLRKRPVIELAHDVWTVPVINHLGFRATDGIYYDLLDANSGERGNRFAEAFGLLFERYVGLLLVEQFGQDAVFPEPAYGKSELRGPDWVVVSDDIVLAVECRSSRVRLQTRVAGELSAVRTDLRRILIDTIRRFPRKVSDLRSGRTPILIPPNVAIRTMVVSMDELEPLPLLQALAVEEVGGEFSPLLISIADFEYLLPLGGRVGLAGMLERRAEPEQLAMPWDQFFTREEAMAGLSRDQVRNGLLARAHDSLWDKLREGYPIPADAPAPIIDA